MMYSEFVAGTGCKQTEFNYNVFLKLEEIYTNSDLTKEEIYTIGKMRVDNSETEAERKARELVEKVCAELEERIAELVDLLDATQEKLRWCKDRKEQETDPEFKSFWNETIAANKRYLKTLRQDLAIEKSKLRLMRA